MARSSVRFVCNSCGYESKKWYGKCPECNSWNTLEEVKIPDPISSKFAKVSKSYSVNPRKIFEIESFTERRISTGFEEFDRVLGGLNESNVSGGIVPGSVTLLSGDPGIGKSTLLLQLALNLSRVDSRKVLPSSAFSREKRQNYTQNNTESNQPGSVLYISGEESEHQVKMRAERIVGEKKLADCSLSILSTTDIDIASHVISEMKPLLVIVDSVQTLATQQLPSFPGSVPQIRYVTSRLVSLAKNENIPVFMVGHVTKEGIVAGPMVLSHMVDTVLYLEGEGISGTRILRSHKNRFGDTSEVGIFIMEEKGLIEIQNTENFFLNSQNAGVPGSCLTVTLEGSRPLIVEIQALVVPTTFAYPRRIAQGISDKRIELLLAVIQKHARIPVEKSDVFVNVVGGLKIKEPAADFAICLAIASSVKNRSMARISKTAKKKSLAVVGEVGLLGELKSVPNLEKRIKEAKKFGFASPAPNEFQNIATAIHTLLDA